MPWDYILEGLKAAPDCNVVCCTDAMASKKKAIKVSKSVIADN